MKNNTIRIIVVYGIFHSGMLLPFFRRAHNQIINHPVAKNIIDIHHFVEKNPFLQHSKDLFEKLWYHKKAEKFNTWVDRSSYEIKQDGFHTWAHKNFSSKIYNDDRLQQIYKEYGDAYEYYTQHLHDPQAESILQHHEARLAFNLDY